MGVQKRVSSSKLSRPCSKGACLPTISTTEPACVSAGALNVRTLGLSAVTRRAWTNPDDAEVGQDKDAKVPGLVVSFEALQHSSSKSSAGLC